jgi:CHAT domain-containing protein/tetratricopeptide (TPR) repeat protein
MRSEAHRLRAIEALAISLVLAISLCLHSIAQERLHSPVSHKESLELGIAIKKAIGAGEAHSYAITLRAGEFAHIVVEQIGIDLVLAIRGPDGEPIAEMDSTNGKYGPEPISTVAELAGTYQLEIRPFEKQPVRGLYEVKLLARRTTTAMDVFRVEAEKNYSQGVKFLQGGREEKEQASVKFTNALSSYRVIGDSEGQIAALDGLGAATQSLGNDQKAFECFQNATQLVDGLGDSLSYSYVLVDLARQYARQAKNKEAENMYRRVLSIYEKMPETEDSDLTALQLELTALLLGMKDFAAARLIATKVLTGREEKLGADDLSLLQPLDALWVVAANEKNYHVQLTIAQRAVSIAEKNAPKEVSSLGYWLYLLGLSQLSNEQLDLGLASFRRSEPFLEISFRSDPKRLASYFIQFGWALTNVGRLADAEPVFTKALSICEDRVGADEPMTARALTALGWVHWGKREFGLAEKAYERALSVSEHANGPTHVETIRAVGDLARLYISQGAVAKSGPLFQRLMAIHQQQPTLDISRQLTLLGDSYSRESDYKRARLAYEAVLGGCRKLGTAEHQCRAAALFNVGQTYVGPEEAANAERFFRQSIAEYEKVGNPSQIANSLRKFAEALQNRKKTEEAEGALKRARSIILKDSSSENLSLASVTWDLALLEMDAGRLDESLAHIHEAMEIDNKYLGKALLIGSEFERSRYVSTIGENSRYRRLLAVDPSVVSSSREALMLGAELIVQRKGLVQEVVADELSYLRRLEDPEIHAKLEELGRVRTRIANLVLTGPNHNGKEEGDSGLRLLTERSEQLQVELSRKSARFRKAIQPVTVAQMQRSIPRDAALVEYLQFLREFTSEEKNPKPDTFTMVGPGGKLETYSFPKIGPFGVGAGRYVAYVFFPNGDPQRVDLGDADDINATALEFRAAMSNLQNEAKARRLARELDEKMMRPIRKVLRGRLHVFVSPDGDLSLIPFAALRDEGGHYLAEKYQFSYVNSGRELLRLGGSTSDRDKPAIYANPTFGRESHSLSARRSADREAVKSMDFESLVATETEAVQVASLLGAQPPLTGKVATKSSLQRLHGPKVLHIATHGVFLEDLSASDFHIFDIVVLGLPSAEDDAMYRSGLVFADGILSSAEAANLDLWGTELVTLSACETGLGKVHNGEGVIGLRRAFALAGARSVLMSLWKVDDEATRDLMLTFYRAILRGESRAAALRAAQMELIKEGRQPYYWAAWLLSGDKGPLILTAN